MSRGARATDRLPRPGTTGFVVVLLVAALLGAGFAAFATQRAADVRDRLPANAAVVQKGATGRAAAEVAAALEQVWAYDYRDLDTSAAALDAATTRRFRDAYADTRARIVELAPPAKAVVTAKVVDIAVQRLRGDRAVLIAFLDQSATKDGGTAAAGARLRVEAVRVDGRWRVDAIEPF